MSENTDETASSKRPVSLKKIAIQTIMVGIAAECERDKKTPPQGRGMMREAIRRYQSSIKNGEDDHLGTAEPRTS